MLTAAEMRDSTASSAERYAAIARECRGRAERALRRGWRRLAASWARKAEQYEQRAGRSRARSLEWAFAARREGA